MNFIEKIKLVLKKIFSPKRKVKTLYVRNEEDDTKRTNFSQSLKVEQKLSEEIETRICVGDGLGFQKKIKF